jgi:hypothetical protein
MSSRDGIAYDEHSEYPHLVMGMELDEWFDFDDINPDSKIGVRSVQHIAKTPLQKRSAENATKVGRKVPVYCVTQGSLRIHRYL